MSQCPACGHMRATEWGSHADHKILQCDACLSTFFPRPIAQVNNYSSYYPYLSGFDASRAQAELRLRSRQSTTKISRIRSAYGGSPSTLLDIGAGPGYFVKYAANVGILSAGIEISDEARQFGEKQFNVEYVSMLDAKKQKWDVVTAFHVLEHLVEPEALKDSLRDLCRPGSLLYIHVPVAETMSDRFRFKIRSILRREADRRGSLYLPDHLTGFSLVGLNSLMSRLGFEVIDWKYVYMLDNEFDPSFIRFNFTPKAVLRYGVNVTQDMINRVTRSGNWISMISRKL